jgi:hypothetical protein
MKRSTENKAFAGAAAGCIGVAVLIKLSFLALIAWGIFELVIWVTSQ